MHKVMQNSVFKFRQISIIFEKPGYFSEKLKIFTSSNYPFTNSKLFLLKFCTRFLLNNVYKKGARDFFLMFANNARSKQNKKIPNTAL